MIPNNLGTVHERVEKQVKPETCLGVAEAVGSIALLVDFPQRTLIPRGPGGQGKLVPVIGVGCPYIQADVGVYGRTDGVLIVAAVRQHPLLVFLPIVGVKHDFSSPVSGRGGVLVIHAFAVVSAGQDGISAVCGGHTGAGGECGGRFADSNQRPALSVLKAIACIIQHRISGGTAAVGCIHSETVPAVYQHIAITVGDGVPLNAWVRRADLAQTQLVVVALGGDIVIREGEGGQGEVCRIGTDRGQNPKLVSLPCHCIKDKAGANPIVLQVERHVCIAIAPDPDKTL